MTPPSAIAMPRPRDKPIFSPSSRTESRAVIGMAACSTIETLDDVACDSPRNISPKWQQPIRKPTAIMGSNGRGKGRSSGARRTATIRKRAAA